MFSRLKNYLRIFLASSLILLALLLLPLILVVRALTDLYCVLVAICVENASTFGNRLWSLMEKLLPVCFIGLISLCACTPNPLPQTLTINDVDTIVCKLTLDSAYLVIDEKKVEYFKN